MNDPNLSRLLETDSALAAPILEGSPSGMDLAYDPDLERLGAELEKLTSLAGETPDWHFVSTESERLLREKSKDLRLMSWFVAARVHNEGWPGLVFGLANYAALTRTFWPTLFPPKNRLRARAGQVEWLWGVLAKRVSAMPANAADAPLVRSLEPLMAELSAFFTESLMAADPGIGSLRAAVREKLRSLPAIPAPSAISSAAGSTSSSGSASTSGAATDGVSVLPPPTPPPRRSIESSLPATGSAASAPPNPPPSERTVAAPPPKATERITAVAAPELASVALDPSALANLDATLDAARPLREHLTTLAHHGRKTAPTSAWPYRTLRLAAWLTVERAPEAEEGHKTPLRAPKAQDRDLLVKLHAGGQWDALLEASEDAISANLFWIDPHRMSAIALDRKGPEFRLAHQTIARETARFAERVPGLLSLTFSNGSPFASPETADWITVEQARFTKRATTATGNGAATPEETNLVSELEEKVAIGPPEEAFAHALYLAERLGSPRSRFRSHLAIARKALAGERLDLAHALYDRLVQSVNPTLEAWEPELCAEAFAGLLKLLSRTPDRADSPKGEAPIRDLSPGNASAANLLFRRLLVVDPQAALRSRH